MKNLLNSTDIATLFLDGDLRVRRFTTPTANIINLIPSDAGRPITDISRDIDYPELAEDAREVLRSLVFKERQVAGTHDRWFNVRILPYRTLDNVIDGVVITFTDASATKSMELTLQQQTGELRQMLEGLPHFVWGCRVDGACDYVSPHWLEYTGATAAELLGYGWLHLVHADDRESTRQKWRAAVKANAPFDAEFRLRAKDGSYRWFSLHSTPIRDAKGTVVKWYGANTDIHEAKMAAGEQRKITRYLANVIENGSDPYLTMADGQTISHANDAAQHIFGLQDGALIGKRAEELMPEFGAKAFRDTFREVLRDKHELSLPLHFKHPDRGGKFQAHVIPSGEGIAVWLQRESSGSKNSPGGASRGKRRG
jgi:two-component system CheB/CheR fusion protein